MRLAEATARYTMRLHGSTWWWRLWMRLWLAWDWRKMRRLHDPTGRVVWSGTVEVCLEPSTCTRTDCLRLRQNSKVVTFRVGDP